MRADGMDGSNVKNDPNSLSVSILNISFTYTSINPNSANSFRVFPYQLSR